MGAAILLQSLKVESRFCAVAAESSFSSFRDIAFYRIGYQLGGGEWLGRLVLRPIVEAGLLYGRLRYGVNLSDAQPVECVAGTSTPILLIHGRADDNIPLRDSETIYSKARANSFLWKVRGAHHTGAMSVAPAEFERRVIDFFGEAASDRSTKYGK